MANNITTRLLAAPAIAAILAGAAPANATLPERFSPQGAGYLERARTMLASGNYGGVIDQLRILHTEGVDLAPADEEEYVYMLAKAYYERGDAECLRLLREFVREYPASSKALAARMAVADYYFFSHQWPEALTEYSAIDGGRLNRTEYPLYCYRLTLCRIKTGHFAEARESLNALRDNGEYREAYTFYSAYLDYIEGDYDKAYSLFSKVRGGEKGLESAYYMTQIDYTRGEFEKVAREGENILRNLNDPELTPELCRVTGLSLFKLGEYSRARKLLRRYMDSTAANPASDAVYALGVTDYDEGDYEAASERFSTLTELDNDIAQSAWLYMGQCDVATGNDDAAAMAFEKAARMGYDRNVSETALYNYVAAVTRGGKVPFSSSVDLLEGFIRDYPHSEYTPKVEEYLATAYYNERDYAKALKNIKRIKNPSASVMAAKQKVLYELGIESMTNGRTSEAASYLERSIGLARHDRKLAEQARFWLGDARYSLGEYGKAASAYSAFLKSEPAGSNRTLALYDLAYAEYMQEKYSAAAGEFAKAVDARPALPAALLADALVRMADCRYYTGDYRSARKAYADAIERGSSDADYAAYRHAVMTGLGGDVKGKLKELGEMQKRYPGSKWMPNALLEKALTYEALDDNARAKEAFTSLAQEYPRSAQARKAMLNLAINYSKTGDREKAAETYRGIIRNWPSSEEAQLANEDLRKYCASNGTLAEYAAFLRTVPEAAQLDAGEMEQLAFDGAETAYADDMSNIRLLQNYVRDYPDGKYLAAALLDIAQSRRAAGDFTEAEAALSRIATDRPHSVQYPEALMMRAEILENDLPGRAADAAAVYKELEKTGDTDFMADALAGVARTSADDNERVAYARRARNSGGLAPETADDMRLVEALALIRMKQDGEGTALLGELAANPSGEAGAQAAVELGQYYLNRREFAKAEKAMLEFTEAGTPHSLQLARGFLVLADAYTAQGKAYLAKEYLQSLKENYPGDEREILDGINSRLKAIGNKNVAGNKKSTGNKKK